MFKNYKLKNFNFRLVFYCLILCTIGYLAIGSAVSGNYNEGLENKQLMGIAIGFTAMMILTFVDYHLYMKFFWAIHLVNLGLLLLTKFAGVSSHNAKRWLKLGPLPQIQPSEFSKIMLILVMAALLGIFKEKINKVWTIAIVLTVCATAWALIVDEPDLSTTIVCCFIFCAIYYIAGISYKWILGVLGVTLPIGIWGIWALLNGVIPETILKEYQQGRILSFIFPKQYADEWYQQEYSIIAIASGGLSGKGLNTDSYASVKTGNFLSEAQTDFIFTIVGEELGFLGTCAVILLLILVVFECFQTAYRARDLEGKIIAGGVGSLIAFQGCINIAVATGCMCNTGIPLPFVSAGISSLLSMFIGIGLVMNVGMMPMENFRNYQQTISAAAGNNTKNENERNGEKDAIRITVNTVADAQNQSQASVAAAAARSMRNSVPSAFTKNLKKK